MLEQVGPTSRIGIPSRHSRYWLRPSDSQVNVIESYGDVLGRVVGPVDSVTHVGGRGQSLESMQESGGDVEVMKVFVVEQECAMLAESRRFPAYIDDDVINGAVRAAHQLSFAETRTAVHAPDYSLCRARLRVLHERGRRAYPADEFVETYSVKGSSEQTAGIMNRIGDEDRDPSEIGLFNSHGSMLP